MKKVLFSFVFCPLVSTSGFGSMAKSGDMIGSGGAGLTMGPTLVLLSPEVEYAYRSDLNFGGLVQLGFGSGFLITTSGKARWTIGHDPKFHPTFETGLGLAVGSSVFDSSAGVHIFFGGGFDYMMSKDTSIGTMFRLNFAPPLDGFFVSWPVVVGRFRL